MHLCSAYLQHKAKNFMKPGQIICHKKSKIVSDLIRNFFLCRGKKSKILGEMQSGSTYAAMQCLRHCLFKLNITFSTPMSAKSRIFKSFFQTVFTLWAEKSYYFCIFKPGSQKAPMQCIRHAQSDRAENLIEPGQLIFGKSRKFIGQQL